MRSRVDSKAIFCAKRGNKKEQAARRIHWYTSLCAWYWNETKECPHYEEVIVNGVCTCCGAKVRKVGFQTYQAVAQ